MNRQNAIEHRCAKCGPTAILLALLITTLPTAGQAQSAPESPQNLAPTRAVPQGPIGPGVDRNAVQQSMRQVMQTSREVAPQAYASPAPVTAVPLFAGGLRGPVGEALSAPAIGTVVGNPLFPPMALDPNRAQAAAVVVNVPDPCASSTDAEERRYCLRMQHVQAPRVNCAGMGSPQGQAHCEKQVAALNACRASRTAAEMDACQQGQRAMR